MKVNIETDIPPHILEEIEAEKPSSDPAYWAKSNCKECYGRGIIGNIKSVVGNNNTISHQLQCTCSKKRYRKWLERKYAERQKAKADLSSGNHS